VPSRIDCGKASKVLVLACGLASNAATENTLSRALQSGATAAMAGHPGTAVVLDVASGKILARSRLDIAARRVAPPGSAIKPFTLLALLRSGSFNPKQRVLCRRALKIAGKEMNCSHPDISSGFDAAEALAYSCNFYFATFASQLTEEGLNQEFQRAGLLSSTGLAAGEAVGSIRHPANDDQFKLLALGQDGIAVTPLELLRAYRGLALRQRSAQPSDAAWEIVSRGLEGSAGYGMAHSAQPDGLAVAGKTGTAGSSTSPLTHGWFAGYAPADDPEIVLVVYLEHGRGMDAAARARKIFAAYQRARGAK
jgi:cell division protein FtsI/penicillin-binding protein 2